MDAFEHVVSELLWARGYWVRTSMYVNLTKAEKKRIGRPTSPRWELDLVAYKGGTNELLVVECKSFLDSPGVRFSGFAAPRIEAVDRYKLFTDARLRSVVLKRLRLQLAQSNGCPKNVKTRLCLACGRFASPADKAQLKEFFRRKGWLLFDSDWLRENLKSMADRGYENHPSAVVAKLLLRVQERADKESAKANSGQRPRG